MGKDYVALKQLIIIIFESSGKGPSPRGEETGFLTIGYDVFHRWERKT